MNAIAQIAQVKVIMTQIVKLDESYKQGAGHLYLAVLATLLPPALGGQPEISKQHFQQALNFSENKNFVSKNSMF